MKVKHWINKKNGKRENSLGLWNIGVHTRRLKTNGTFTCSVRFSGPPRPTGNTMLRALILRQFGFLLHSNGTKHVGFNILKVYRLGLRNPVNWLLRIGFVAGFPPLLHRADRSISPAPLCFLDQAILRESAGGSYTPFPPLPLKCLAYWSLRSASLRPLLYCSRPRSMKKRAINNVSLSMSIYRAATNIRT